MPEKNDSPDSSGSVNSSNGSAKHLADRLQAERPLVPEARPYALAYYHLCAQGDHLQAALEELFSFTAAITGEKMLWRALRSPGAHASALRDIIEHLSASLSDPLRRFLLLLVQERRFGLLEQIADACFRIEQKTRGHIEADLATAVACTPEQTARFAAIVSRITGGHAQITQRIDPSLIAGFRIVSASHSIDGSLAGYLQRMRRILEEA